MENETLHSLIRAGKRRPLWEPGPTTTPVSMGRSEVERMLHHRPPFLFVDRLSEFDADQRAVRGEREIEADDPLFAGHFPGAPLYPGVLQLETMGQFGLCMMHLMSGRTEPADVRALKIHHALFLREVLPGDRLTVLGKLVESDEYTAICAGQIFRGDELCSFAVMEVYFVEQ